MAKKEVEAKVERVGLGFRPDDKARLQRIQKKLEPTFGRLSAMAVVRMALIKLEAEDA